MITISIPIPLVIKDFQKIYPNITLQFQTITIEERITIFLGENGSGKSTILKAIANLLSYKGRITNEYKVSYMPEHPTFPRDITVEEFLSILHQQSKNDYDYKPYLKKFGLLTKKDSLIHTLSKGMKAKVNLIACLIKNVDLYLLDEPLSGLDKESIRILTNEMKSSDKIYIISSHLAKEFQGLDYERISMYELVKTT